MANADLGPTQPYKTPVVDKQTLIITKPWSIWFEQVVQAAFLVIRSIAGLTNHAIVLADGTSALKSGPLGTATTVLHGAAAGDPTYSKVALAADVSGVLPVANGGTGASNAGDARTNLAAAESSGIGAGTVTLAALTGGGTQGSISWNADGSITAVIAPT